MSDDYKALLDDQNERITEVERMLAERFDVSAWVDIPCGSSYVGQLHWQKAGGKERQLFIKTESTVAPFTPLRYAAPVVRCMAVVELPQLIEELRLAVSERRCSIVYAIEVATAAAATMEGGGT